MKKLLTILFAFVLIITALGALASCEDSADEPTPADITTEAAGTQSSPGATAAETPGAPGTIVTVGAVEDEPEPAPQGDETMKIVEVTGTPETTGDAEPEPPADMPQYINPLTGLAAASDFTGKRPLAIMINNIKASCPQVGISDADIMYECLVEGGYTRLMMVVTDYAGLGVVGSVRSSRDYYLDFAANHDAIYIHAGGSPMAYEQMAARAVDHIDGVNMYTPNALTFYRDRERLKTMSPEHTLMTTGEGLVFAVDYWRCRTEQKADFTSPLNFVGWGEEYIPDAGESLHVIIPYSYSQYPQFIYSPSSKTYYRFQFNGEEHIDQTTGEQLQFTNVIIIFCPTSYADSYGRLAVDTTGEGDGYYVYGGKYIPIKWQKADRDSELSFTRTDGTPLLINRGKTFISVASTSIKNKVSINYTGD